ncbi:uncharacterized protein LOC126837356 [Adelges cooleyi]|uniref:uncharacterized protein LOC126837356 n=1 Tax=Adelges cooleyi TaxID=133065 RepID=UPI00217F4791|nr:uncharacterized protein LOC126837356 [Adelges cooleyi]
MNFKLILFISLLSVLFLNFSFAQNNNSSRLNSIANMFSTKPKPQQSGNGGPLELAENERMEVNKETPNQVQKTAGGTAMNVTKNTINSLKNMMRKKPTQLVVEDKQIDEEVKEENIQGEEQTDEDSAKIDADKQFILDNADAAGIGPTVADEEVHVEEQETQNDEDLATVDDDKQFILDNADAVDNDPTVADEEVPITAADESSKEKQSEYDQGQEKEVIEPETDTDNLEVNDPKPALLPEDEREETPGEELEAESGKNEGGDASVAKEDIMETNNGDDENTLSDEDHRERVFCVVSGSADPPMRYSRDFPTDICHTIVYGKRIVIDQKHAIPKLNKKDAALIKQYAQNKDNLLFIVIMTHSSYSNWSLALSGKGLDKEVEVVVQFVKKHKVAGVQFANLYPQVGESIDTDMTCKLIHFFTKLTEKMADLGIGLEINAFEPTVATSFPYVDINKHVDWYVLNTIDMVKCSPAYLTGTNPLMGVYSIQNSVLQLLASSSIEEEKVVIGLQMFATAPDGKRHSYGQMCKKANNNTKEWCAESSETLYLKGYAMRFLDILGVQLYYVDTDDFMGWCDCDFYPGFRALHAGLWNIPLESVTCQKLGHTEAGQPAVCKLTTVPAAVSVDQDDST